MCNLHDCISSLVCLRVSIFRLSENCGTTLKLLAMSIIKSTLTISPPFWIGKVILLFEIKDAAYDTELKNITLSCKEIGVIVGQLTKENVKPWLLHLFIY